MRVLIAGAGPTGLTAAVELARRGVEVEVAERRDAPSELSRAVGILPASIAILTPSGAASAIMREAVAFTAFMVYRDADLVADLPLNFDDRSRLWGLAQDRTEEHLIDALARHGASVRYGSPLEGFEQDETGVDARYGDREGRFDDLIGADGVDSVVRRTLGLAYDGFELPHRWSIADVICDDWPEPTAFKGFLLPHGHVVIVAPIEAARFRVIASLPDALKALPVPMRVREIRRTGEFRISVRQADRYGEGRVLLAGDAAHCHSPAGGRGMNLGIADAAELAERMTSGRLDGYSASRHAAGAHVIAFSERGRKTVQSDNPIKRATVFAAMRAMGSVPALGRAGIHQFATG